ncbi:MAG: glycoside hydrolase family 97 catalytic domain-containing protein [Rikenellaceae bacterium]
MKKLRQIIFTSLLLLFGAVVTSCTQCTNPANVSFGSLTLSVDNTDCGALTYTLTKGDADVALLENSPIVININNEVVEWQVVGCTPSKSVEDAFDMVTGEQKHVTLSYLEKEFSLKGATASDDNIEAKLIVRLYDDTFAYRLVVENDGDYKIKESSEYILADTTGGCYAPNGEREPFGNVAIGDFDGKYTTPVIYSSESTGVVAFHESDLHNYPQLYMKGNGKDGLKLIADEAAANGTMVLPWRVVLTGDSIVDLHSQKSVYLSLSQPAEGDFSWVTPGFSTWDWRVKGCVFGGEKYEMTTNSLKRYIDFCARHGLEYFLVDAEWYDRKLPIVPVEGLDIEEVIRHGNEVGVGMLIYYDLNYMKTGLAELDFDEVCAKFKSWGAKGIKYGFLGSFGIVLTSQQKVAQCEYLIKTAAKHQLIIDFHDHPIPHGGLERQYPNYINREYCHAQMDRRWAFTPNQFTMMACVNFLAGPMDQTNGTYALNTIKSRSKGPNNEYFSTVAAETARAFVTHTGNLSVLLDAPEAYEEFGDIFEFISSMPNQWDEAKYLDMDWGKRIAIARRGGCEWFLGVVYGDEGGSESRTLEFLDPNTTYSATIYRDAATSDCFKEKETYEVVKLGNLTSSDTIDVKVANGGGYSVRFVPVK